MSKIEIATLHDETLFSASSTVLDGRELKVSDFGAVWLWCVPLNGYDGTLNFEVSPDNTVSWFPLTGVALNAPTSPITTVVAPVAANSYIIGMPRYSHFRARLSGGTVGSLTVYCRLVEFGAII